MSDSLQPHGLKHYRLPCLSLSPKAGSNLNQWWCHPTIWSSVIPFSCPQYFQASGSFPVSWLFPSSGKSIGASASASVLPMNIQVWFPLGWTGWLSLQSKGLSNIFSSTTVQKHQFFSAQPSLWSDFHICTWDWKNHSFNYMDFCQQRDVSFFYMLSRLVIAFLPRSTCFLISWLQSPYAVILEPKKIKSVTVSIFSSYLS